MTPEIELEGLCLSRAGQRVLDKVSCRLMPGERVALTGPNGAGKTTLLRCIVGLERAEAGQVRLAGASCVTEAEFRRARPAIGFLFQESDDQLFCPTVIEDVAFGPLNLGLTRVQAFDRAAAELATLGLSHLAQRPVHRLSGGEKRLVCLAGLLAMAPRVLLLDEPDTALDPAARDILLHHLDRFTGAMVLVTHDAGLAGRLGARVMSLVGGQIGH